MTRPRKLVRESYRIGDGDCDTKPPVDSDQGRQDVRTKPWSSISRHCIDRDLLEIQSIIGRTDFLVVGRNEERFSSFVSLETV